MKIFLWETDHWNEYSYNTLADIELELANRRIGIGYNVTLGDSIYVGFGSFIGSDSVIGDNVKIGNNVIIRDLVNIGADCDIHDNAVIKSRASIESNVSIGESAIVGSKAVVRSGATVCQAATVASLSDVPVDAHVTRSLLICGSKDPVSWYGLNELHIGCMTHTIDYWLENYVQIATDQGYTSEQIEEYGKYINICSELYLGS